MLHKQKAQGIVEYTLLLAFIVFLAIYVFYGEATAINRYGLVGGIRNLFLKIYMLITNMIM